MVSYVCMQWLMNQADGQIEAGQCASNVQCTSIMMICKQIVILETDGMCNFHTHFLNNNTWTHNKVIAKDFMLRNNTDH